MALELSPAGRRYGAIPSPPDHRDFGISSIPRLRAGPVPSKDLHLQAYLGPVRDQGQEGSCTAHAAYALRMMLANQFEGNRNRVQFSPAFIYYLERQLEGSLPADAGATLRTACRVLYRFGACPERDDPYGPYTMNQPPSPQALADAQKYRAGAYHRILSVEDMKSCIRSGYGAMIGFMVYESFEDPMTARTGMMRVPDKNRERPLGGHAVFIWGYDDSLQAFIAQNSWGEQWGQNGHFWFPYACFADPGILFEAWIQHLGPPWRPKGLLGRLGLR